MTVQEARGKVLALFDDEPQVTDYDGRIYTIMDSVQTEIATTVKPIRKLLDVSTEEKKIQLPNDCFEVVRVLDSDMYPVPRWVLADGFVYVEADGDYKLQYNAYPAPIVDADSVFSISLDCQEALVYGVAAALVNDEAQYDVYLAKYNNMLANIFNRDKSHITVIPRRGGI